MYSRQTSGHKNGRVKETTPGSDPHEDIAPETTAVARFTSFTAAAINPSIPDHSVAVVGCCSTHLQLAGAPVVLVGNGGKQLSCQFSLGHGRRGVLAAFSCLALFHAMSTGRGREGRGTFALPTSSCCWVMRTAHRSVPMAILLAPRSYTLLGPCTLTRARAKTAIERNLLLIKTVCYLYARLEALVSEEDDLI